MKSVVEEYGGVILFLVIGRIVICLFAKLLSVIGG